MSQSLLSLSLGTTDIIIIVAVILAAVAAGIYFLNKWAAKRYAGQMNIIDKNKRPATIYIIDKRKDMAKNVNLPKAVKDNLPKIYGVIKTYFVQAKAGANIATFMCDKNVFESLPVKKTVKVELAGMYIASVKGAKPPAERKAEKKARDKAKKNAG
jgi:hypothetical protein